MRTGAGERQGVHTAEHYHLEQIEAFSQAGVDLVTATDERHVAAMCRACGPRLQRQPSGLRERC